VWLAAADDEAEAFGRGVVEAGNSDPGVLLGVGEFLLGGDVLGPARFWRTINPTVWPCAVMVKWGCALRRR
jgi:hypothetical protein